jgi:hypothetical protein
MSAFEQNLVTITLTSAVDHSGDQYLSVNALGVVTGTASVGVLQNNPESNEAMTVAYGGVSKCIALASETIAVGDTVGFDANGKIVAAGTDAGVALTAHSGAADDEVISVLLQLQ